MSLVSVDLLAGFCYKGTMADVALVQCMAEVGRLESCKAEVMRRLITDKWADVEAVCAASHLVVPAIPAMFDAAVSTNRVPNSGQVTSCQSSCPSASLQQQG